MKKVTAMGLAAVVAAGVLVACSSSNSGNGGNSNAFPFSGPSCPPGMQATTQPGTSTSSACSQCLQSHCSGASQCVVTDCADFFNCFCACAMNDANCAIGCFPKLTQGACASCNMTVGQCRTQNCSTECSAGVDAGAID